MPDYQSNTNKSKMQRPETDAKKVEKVIVGEVIQKRKSPGRMFKEIFFGGNVKTASRYVAAEVLLPALRNMVVDTGSKMLERVIYGESARRGGRPVDYRSNVQYNNPMRRELANPIFSNVQDSIRGYRPDPRPRTDSSQLILSTREEATTVIERMIDILEKYDAVSVADLNDLVGLPTTHIDNKWGWVYLQNVEVRQIRDGFLLDLPSPQPI